MQKIIKNMNDYEDTLNMLAEKLAVGDCLLLQGDLGVGKTTFAKLLIRKLCKDDNLQVRSPSFSLLQIYENAAVPIYHYDFYRLQSQHEIQELGLDEAFGRAITLIEWPEILGDQLPPHYYHIHISERADGLRHITLTKR